MNLIIQKTRPYLFATVASFLFAITTAHAQGMNNNAWSPQASNRAAIASLIRQVEQEDSNTNSGALGFAGSSVTQLICGSNSGEGTGASANAQANSSCIILNNSDGALNINQDSEGEQTADAYSTDTITIDETINEAGGADDVLATLAGE